ncbi:MAG: hypothetical protein C4308_02500 [Chitinophagaceae bacterium]
MKIKLLLLCLSLSFICLAQNDTTDISLSDKKDTEPTKVFYSQRLINANTVEVLSKGILEFRVMHNFWDIAGNEGGIKNFFGLDNAADAKIAFQLGLSNRFNILAARTKGNQGQTKLWELGLKYQFLQQMINDSRHALSLTVFANVVAASDKKAAIAGQENSYEDFGDRLNQLVQLMIAKKFGGVSLQLSPTYLHQGLVIPGADESIFAIGGGIRLPVTKKFSIISDYFHPFLSSDHRQAYRNRGLEMYDAFSVGFEVLTWGHVFHLNFTNTTEILENKFLPRTWRTWSKGQFRWAFIIERKFTLFREKNKQ